jgi:hypothetical protein
VSKTRSRMSSSRIASLVAGAAKVPSACSPHLVEPQSIDLPARVVANRGNDRFESWVPRVLKTPEPYSSRHFDESVESRAQHERDQCPSAPHRSPCTLAVAMIRTVHVSLLNAIAASLSVAFALGTPTSNRSRAR